MTMPAEYRTAAEDFERFLAAALDESGLATRNQVYTMVQGVFQAFRRRLDVRDAIRFADALPPLLRALFVADWDVDEPKRPFGTREAMTQEVQALRIDHNFAPDTAIRDVAAALRRSVDASALDRVLAELPNGARAFWSV